MRFYIGSKSAFTSQNMNSADNILYLWTDWTKGDNSFPDCPNKDLSEMKWIVQQWDNFPKKANGQNGIITWEKSTCHCTYPVISIWYGDFSPFGMYILFTKHFKVNFGLTPFTTCLFQAIWK